jgi:hypothetical protein
MDPSGSFGFIKPGPSVLLPPRYRLPIPLSSPSLPLPPPSLLCPSPSPFSLSSPSLSLFHPPSLHRTYSLSEEKL